MTADHKGSLAPSSDGDTSTGSGSSSYPIGTGIRNVDSVGGAIAEAASPGRDAACCRTLRGRLAEQRSICARRHHAPITMLQKACAAAT